MTKRNLFFSSQELLLFEEKTVVCFFAYVYDHSDHSFRVGQYFNVEIS